MSVLSSERAKRVVELTQRSKNSFKDEELDKLSFMVHFAPPQIFPIALVILPLPAPVSFVEDIKSHILERRIIMFTVAIDFAIESKSTKCQAQSSVHEQAAADHSSLQKTDQI